MCIVCDERTDRLDSNRIHAGQTLCLPCSQMYLHSTIADEAITDIPCPFGPCDRKLPFQFIKEYASSADFELYAPLSFARLSGRYDRLLLRSWYESDPKATGDRRSFFCRALGLVQNGGNGRTRKKPYPGNPLGNDVPLRRQAKGCGLGSEQD
jgi:hypothetical protein